jgi:hypothetical protein
MARFLVCRHVDQNGRQEASVDIAMGRETLT